MNYVELILFAPPDDHSLKCHQSLPLDARMNVQGKFFFSTVQIDPALFSHFEKGMRKTEEQKYIDARMRMVETQIIRRGIRDARVLDALRRVPRHLFVPEELRFAAYKDLALPIRANQTISQPYIVALMTSLLHLQGGENILEVGTGSGYQAAVLSLLARHVTTIEFLQELAHKAFQLLRSLSINNVDVITADGSKGYLPTAPYDGIIVTAAAPSVPPAFMKQMTPKGRLVLPVGGRGLQELQIWTQHGNSWQGESVLPVEFVPLRGEHGWSNADWPDY